MLFIQTLNVTKVLIENFDLIHFITLYILHFSHRKSTINWILKFSQIRKDTFKITMEKVK